MPINEGGVNGFSGFSGFSGFKGYKVIVSMMVC
jgi:hypothetical protein